MQSQADQNYQTWRAHNADTLKACYSSIQIANRCWDLVDAAYPDKAERKAAFARINAELDALPRRDLDGRVAVMEKHIAALEAQLGAQATA